mmetsp:Transcript_27246/g.39922  ORF Transcript_27246/g.39922 Transcript_27246/m.39922 type:complete len:210 (+) Transcript_27246:2086-2715(+)
MPRRHDMQIPVASAHGWFKPYLTSQPRDTVAAYSELTSFSFSRLFRSALLRYTSSSSFVFSPAFGSQRRIVSARTPLPSVSPLSLTGVLTSSRALIVILHKRSSLIDAVTPFIPVPSSSISMPPPPSSPQLLPTIMSANAPQAPTRARHSLLPASSVRISIVVKKCCDISALLSAPPPVKAVHRLFICSRVCLLGSLHARSNRGMSFPR